MIIVDSGLLKKEAIHGADTTMIANVTTPLTTWRLHAVSRYPRMSSFFCMRAMSNPVWEIASSAAMASIATPTMPKSVGRKDPGEDDDLDEPHRPFDAAEPQQPDAAPHRALRERVAGFQETPEEAEELANRRIPRADHSERSATREPRGRASATMVVRERKMVYRMFVVPRAATTVTMLP